MDLHEFTSLNYKYSSTYFTLQVDPGQCFHSASPQAFIDERREQQQKLPNWVGSCTIVKLRTHLAVFTAIAPTPSANEDCSLVH